MVIAVIEQPFIRVDVEFYSSTEREGLLAYPTSDKIGEVVGDCIRIPTQEFLTYYLFHRKRPGSQKFRDYDTISGNTGKALEMLEEFIEFNGESVSWNSETAPLPIYVPENVGESIGLAVMNRIHDLTEADWAKISEAHGPHATKVFDYQYAAADDRFLIEVETKGSCVQNADVKTSSISNHKRSIDEKKRVIKERESKSYGSESSCLRYGTIAVVPSEGQAAAKCLLVDPPPTETPFSARSFRLLNRLRFIRDWIYFHKP